MISLTNRLQTAAELCRKGVVAADIGTDHALLACYLALNGAKQVYASDVREGPLEAARRTIEQTGVTNVTAVLSDGLEKIEYADDVIIAGMGGELIAQIVSGCRFLSENTRFILQPMTKAEHLREYLCENGFEIIEERTAYEGRRAYVVMLVKYTGIISRHDELSALIGKISDPRYLRMISAKLRKKAAHFSGREDFAAECERLESLAKTIDSKAEDFE
ncbi:MAG: class I SAM-dependent methyltransferase [Oscillospiraceae bacterium]